MLLIQILIVAFCLFAIGRAAGQLHSGHLGRVWFGFWFLFWLAVAVVAVLPQTTQIAARFVGVGRGVDLVIYISIIVLFYLVFRLFIKLEEVEREITRLVRKLAIDDLKDKTK
ncbi:DUF2304 domain-containing protein [Patescibacteria group bacterium]